MYPGMQPGMPGAPAAQHSQKPTGRGGSIMKGRNNKGGHKKKEEEEPEGPGAGGTRP